MTTKSQTDANPKPQSPAPARSLSVQYDDVAGLRVSASPDMVATLLQHAGIVQPPRPRPAPPPSIDWAQVMRQGFAAVEQIAQTFKAQQEKEELRRKVQA
jgi:hypothetical protein